MATISGVAQLLSIAYRVTHPGMTWAARPRVTAEVREKGRISYVCC